MNIILYIVTGLIVGSFAGFMGLGGGLILIPILVYCFGLTQHQAQGTSLAVMIPPITLLAALKYYYNGNVKVNIALFIAMGFIIGGLFGANLANKVSAEILKKIFGTVLFLISLRMIFIK